MQQTYPFEALPLPYEIGALEPYISGETLEVHHGRLYNAYVDNLNKLLSDRPELQNLTLEELLRRSVRMPKSVCVPLGRYAGGTYNHVMYFYGMAPESSYRPPQGELARAIDAFFGSFDGFVREFTEAARAVFGSGYTWLAAGRRGLTIINLPNQENPLMTGLYPLMCIDLWEHAYFLDYKNDRAGYIDNWWKLVNWEYAEGKYEEYASARRRS